MIASDREPTVGDLLPEAARQAAGMNVILSVVRVEEELIVPLVKLGSLPESRIEEEG